MTKSLFVFESTKYDGVVYDNTPGGLDKQDIPFKNLADSGQFVFGLSDRRLSGAWF